MTHSEPTQMSTILTIDDEASIRQSFRAFLEDMDYEVLEADGGIKGIEIFKEKQPDLILVDLNMPQMDGLEVLKILKEESPETPLIVISGTGRLSDIAQALRLGAWDYLFKPIHDLTVLEHSIERSLERAKLLIENKTYQQQLEKKVVLRTEELKISETKYKTIFENLQDIYFETTLKGIVLELSPSIEATSQYNRNELIGENILSLYGKEKTRKDFLSILQKEGKISDYEITLRDKDGTPVPCSITAKLITDDTGRAFKICGSIRNIYDRKKAEAALKKSEERYRSLVSNIPVGLYRYSLDSGGSYITVNQAMVNILGYDSIKSLLKTHPNDLYISQKEKEIFFNQLLHRGKVLSSEIQVRKRNGDLLWTAITAYVYKNHHGIIQYIDTMIEDISSRKDAEKKVRRLSYYDFLTELPNRKMFLYRLKQAIASSKRNNSFSGIIIIDLDRFKAINDTLGHELGDMFLQHVAQRISETVRDEDTVARIGGDEFAIIFSELAPTVEEAGRIIQNISEKIRADLAHPFLIEEHELYVTASIGIAMFPGTSDTNAEEVLKHASTAVNRVKEGERNRCLFYLPNMQQSVNKRLTLEKELRIALSDNQFQLFYQPQTNFSGRIIGAEALIRWTHPEKGIISPAEFIPVAEENGLILPIGDWVFQTACSHLKQWKDLNILGDLKYISINVSPLQFSQADFSDNVQQTLSTTNLPASLLSIEITEGVAIDNLEDTIKKMQSLKELGISFSIDDFGTGYSSLSYLNRLPIDQLKIDRSFVTNIADGSSFASIVATIIVMAKSMGFSVVAEGVETEGELEFLINKDCNIFQGYYFSKPLPHDEFQEKLKIGKT